MIRYRYIRHLKNDMNANLDIFNPYVRRARLQPAMLVALPFGLATLAFWPNGIAGWGTVWSLFVFCGGTALMAQMARDMGKIKEPGLFASWGGKPTTQLLRHRSTENKVLLFRRHERLKKLIPELYLPSPDEELADVAAADMAYDTCTAFLIEKTRKKDTFPLVFEENCNYGFRRNLWGMKPLGLATSLIGTGAVTAIVLLEMRSGKALSPTTIACGVINLVMLLSWIVWFTPSWVRIAGFAYADRLLAACETLKSGR